MQDAGVRQQPEIGRGPSRRTNPLRHELPAALQLDVHMSGVAADTPTNANWAAGYRSCTATHLDSCIFKRLISSVERGQLPISWPVLFR
jgi:hypothetical protein